MSRIRPVLAAALTAGAFAGLGCAAAHSGASARPGEALVVADAQRQEIDGWGSALTSDLEPLINEADLSPALRNRLYTLLFRDLGESLMRVFVGDFGTAAAPPPADGSGGSMTRRIAFIRAARAYGVRIMLTGADAPADWKDGNRLRPGMERAYGDYLVDWAGRLAALGARADTLAIANEVSNPDFFNMTEDQAAAVYEQMARRIHDGGLGIRLVTGDNENFAHAYSYSHSYTYRNAAASYGISADWHPRQLSSHRHCSPQAGGDHQHRRSPQLHWLPG